ncbi:MAG TPA: phage tail protein, partial [Pyrinomonadaceae bacterium]|nr:phage tail protein [Pyrinomonadaceae bacterium]
MPAPEFKVNTTRYDPYKNFNFRVKWGAALSNLVYVAGISKVSGLTRTTQVVTHRSGGDPSTPRRSPGQSDYGPITLERGVTHDMNFEEWANKVWSYANSTQGVFPTSNKVVSLKDFRKEVVLEMYNEAGQLAISYNIHRCWVSEYVA